MLGASGWEPVPVPRPDHDGGNHCKDGIHLFHLLQIARGDGRLKGTTKNVNRENQ